MRAISSEHSMISKGCRCLPQTETCHHFATWVYGERKARPGQRRRANPHCYQVHRLNSATKSIWESRLITGNACCRLSAAIHRSFAGIGVPALLSSNRMAALRRGGLHVPGAERNFPAATRDANVANFRPPTQLQSWRCVDFCGPSFALRFLARLSNTLLCLSGPRMLRKTCMRCCRTGSGAFG